MKTLKHSLLFILSYIVISSCQKDVDKDTDPVPVGLPVEEVAGTGDMGTADGPIASAQFNRPNGITLDAAGNIYVTDRGNNKIRKISNNGIVSTVAGSGTFGFQDGALESAQFNSPGDLIVDGNGNIYVADWYNHRIRLINSTVSTYAGTVGGFKDGDVSTARFYWPKGITLDANGNFYVADSYNNRIRKITPNGEVTTLAGDGTEGFKEGTGESAQFSQPRSVTMDKNGNIIVADAGNNRIRKITPNGEVSTLAGDGTKGFADGTGSVAKFNSPKGVAVDKNNNVYIADQGNHAIRKITPAGDVTTIAGDGKAGSNEQTDSEPARFNNPRALAIDANSTFLYIADQNNNKIRKIAL